MQRLDILHPSIDDYLLDIIPERDEVLTEMEAHARANRFPIVGPLVGRVLHQLVLITNPTRIFEMGSGFGYDEREQWFHAATIGVRELTRLLYSSSDVFTTIIPLRDGVSVAVKR